MTQASLLHYQPQRVGVSAESRDAYQQIASSGELGARQLEVLRCLRAHPDGLTNNEISRMLGLRINSVTPRVKELREILSRTRDSPLLVRGGSRVDLHTLKRCAVWVYNGG